ncbi:exodeoxyribonuclease III [Thermaurantiacus sp.]
MKFATFNVNGIAARQPRLLEWLDEAKPDVVGLQEIKCEDDRFPARAFEALGWRVATHGQKGFNGVAILSRFPLNDVRRGLAGDASDDQARWIEAKVEGVRFVSLYLPNGNPAPGPKFDYKLSWMERLSRRATELLATEEPVVLAGDYNVCPTDADVARPQEMADDALCRPESRGAFRALVAQGWTDAIRARFPAEEIYTYWDYQAGAWAKNWGLRIDHLLLSPAAADRMNTAGVDREVRAREKASDHVPAWVELR